MKIGKGTLPAQIAGIHTGRHPHSTQLAGGNEEVQRLCGEHGVARGKGKYTVARSENATVVGVILYYKNQVILPEPQNSEKNKERNLIQIRDGSIGMRWT